MEINMSYINDILSFMIEGQYLTSQRPEYYQHFIDHYRDSVFHTLDEEQQEKFLFGLQMNLKYLLNNSKLSYNSIFDEIAFHSFDTETEARKVIEMIWSSFFGDKNWQDADYSDEANITVVRKPIW